MIPIVDMSGRPVAKVIVQGGYQGDDMVFSVDKRLSAEDQKNIKARFDEAILRGSKYAEHAFFGPGRTRVLGWSNFFGIAEALSRCLPGNGLHVEWNNIDWPDDTPAAGDGDLVTEEELEG